jgi:hypothetical protein
MGGTAARGAARESLRGSQSPQAPDYIGPAQDRSGSRHGAPVEGPYLQEAGFENVYNVRVGIEAWSNETDPSVPRY